jgi:hypothetical protein
MSSIRPWFVALALAFSSSLAFAGEKVKLEDVPAPVRETVKREAKDGRVGEIERERKNGRTVYEVEVHQNGKKYELKIGEDGKLIEKKKD